MKGWSASWGRQARAGAGVEELDPRRGLLVRELEVGQLREVGERVAAGRRGRPARSGSRVALAAPSRTMCEPLTCAVGRLA